ncbi:Dihydrofolate reductase [Acinetobacter baumannii]|nr:Dihydrofolate reductase [Acinetobacter baumannii]
MGRHTYEKVRAFPEWPYGELPVVVLSTQPAPHGAEPVRWMSGEPASVVARLAEAGCRHLYIDGGQTVQRFLQAGLIDELTITRVPLLLGGGIPLFGVDAPEQRLRLLAVTQSDNGFVQERYAVQRAS